MNNQEFFNIGLPKWPGMLVVGDKVTREQAMEILIRTDDLEFHCNDHDFAKQLMKEVYDVDVEYWQIYAHLSELKKMSFDDIDNFLQNCTEPYKLVGGLYYLQNSQIVSSWVGGPHGWCDWEGNICSSNYNIGKWPSVESVYKEWTEIAKAFPFLKLRCQLLNEEIYDGAPEQRPLIEFQVSDGVVTMSVPDKLLTAPTPPKFKNFFNPFAERGCSFSLFKEALDYVKNKYKIND